MVDLKLGGCKYNRKQQRDGCKVSGGKLVKSEVPGNQMLIKKRLCQRRFFLNALGVTGAKSYTPRFLHPRGPRFFLTLWVAPGYTPVR